MRNGYGSPYIKAYTSKGEITERITEFSYKFSQKGDDVCILKVEGDDQNMPDYPIYQEGVEYTMVWGYIGETAQQKRLVVLRNIKVTYSDTGITLELLFTDKASLLKTNSAKRVHNEKTAKEVALDIVNRNGLLAVNSTLPTATPQTPPSTTTKPSSGNSFNEAIDGIFEYFGINSLFDTEDDLRVYESVPQANRSDYEVVKEVVDNEPNGPYEIVGRDDALIIAKPNFSQKPLRTYRWKGEDGHLINFTPESKEYFIGAGHLGIGITSMDPRTKTAHETVVTEGNNGVTTKLAPNIATPNYDDADDGSGNTAGTNNADTPTTTPTPIKSDPSIKDKELKTIATTKGGDKSYSPQKELGFGDPKNESFAGRQFVFTSFSAPTELKGAGPLAASTTLPTATPYIPTFLTGQHTPTTEDDRKKAAAKAAALQHKKSLEKNPANAKVIGNVILESGKVLTIENTSRKFSGNYYIQECTHRLNPSSGYFCELEMVRNAQGKVSKPGVNTTDAANKYKKRGAKNEFNILKGPENNTPKTTTVPVTAADQPNPALAKYKFKDTPKGT